MIANLHLAEEFDMNAEEPYKVFEGLSLQEVQELHAAICVMQVCLHVYKSTCNMAVHTPDACMCLCMDTVLAVQPSMGLQLYAEHLVMIGHLMRFRNTRLFTAKAFLNRFSRGGLF